MHPVNSSSIAGIVLEHDGSLRKLWGCIMSTHESSWWVPLQRISRLSDCFVSCSDAIFAKSWICRQLAFLGAVLRWSDSSRHFKAWKSKPLKANILWSSRQLTTSQHNHPCNIRSFPCMVAQAAIKSYMYCSSLSVATGRRYLSRVFARGAAHGALLPVHRRLWLDQSRSLPQVLKSNSNSGFWRWII